MTEKLWTTGDMAKVAGVSLAQASQWPRAWSEFPAPAYTSQSGTLRLYSQETAEWAIDKYLSGKAAREAAKLDRERARRALEWLR